MKWKEKLVSSIAKLLNVNLNKSNNETNTVIDPLSLIKDNQEHIKSLMKIVDKKVVNTYLYSNKLEKPEVTLEQLDKKVSRLIDSINDLKRALIPQQFRAIEAEENINTKLEMLRSNRELNKELDREATNKTIHNKPRVKPSWNKSIDNKVKLIDYSDENVVKVSENGIKFIPKARHLTEI